MAASAYLDTPLLHVGLFESFSEPLVLVAAARDQVMKRQLLVGTTKGTGVLFGLSMQNTLRSFSIDSFHQASP